MKSLLWGESDGPWGGEFTVDKTKRLMTNPNPPLDRSTVALSAHILVCDNISHMTKLFKKKGKIPVRI